MSPIAICVQAAEGTGSSDVPPRSGSPDLPPRSDLPTLLTSRPVAAAGDGPKGRKPRGCSALEIPEETPQKIEISPELYVRNTFLHTAEQRSPSLEAFYRERDVRTCPGMHVGLLQGLFREDTPRRVETAVATPAGRRPIVTPSPSAAGRVVMSLCLADSLDLPPSPTALGFAALPRGFAAAAPEPPAMGLPLAPAPELLPAGVQGLPMYQIPAAPSAPPVLPQGAHSVPPPPSAPAVGSPELPSVGSQGHAAGQCKPCAFLYTKGCENGVSCQFCHLCEDGERQRRRKAKLEAQRTVRKAKQEKLAAALAAAGSK